MLCFYSNGEKIPLQHIVSNYFVTRKSDGNNVLSFNLSKDSDEYKLISNETTVEDDENRYLVKKINGEKFECSLDLDFLKATVHVAFNSGSKLLSQILEEHLPQGWSIQNANVRSIFRTTKFDYCTDYDIIQSCMKTYDVLLVWKLIERTVIVIAPELVEPSGEYLTDELNLKKVSYKSETTGFVTRLYAYGKDGLSFADINDGKPYVDSNSYSSKVVCVEDAQKMVNELAMPVTTYECDVIDIAKQKPDEYGFLDFKLHEVVTLVDRDRNVKVNHHIVQYKEYPDEPDRNVITLSAVAETITSSMQKIQSELTDKIGETEYTLDYRLKEATDRITNCLEGHVFIRHNEILIMDTEDPQTATSLWRWTYGGLGYSNHGYNGPYALAITNDGQIVADRITAGELNGAILKANSVQAQSISQTFKQSIADDIDYCRTTVEQEFTLADAQLKSVIGSSTNKYNTTGKTIDFYGYGLSADEVTTDTGVSAVGNADKYFLNQNNGYLYKSNNAVWVLQEQLTLETDDIRTSITQTSKEISLKVASTSTNFTKNLICPSKHTAISDDIENLVIDDSTGAISFDITGGMLYSIVWSGSSLGLILGHTYVLSLSNLVVSAGIVEYRNNRGGAVIEELRLNQVGDLELEFTYTYEGYFLLKLYNTQYLNSLSISHLMIRDVDIEDGTFSAYVDPGRYLCSQITLSDEQIELNAGRLIYNGGKCTIEADGTLSATAGVFTNCSIIGGTLKVETSGQGDSVIELKYVDSYSTISTTLSPYQTTYKAQSPGSTLMYTNVDYAGFHIQSDNYTYTDATSYSVATNEILCDKITHRSSNSIVLDVANYLTYGQTCMIGISSKPMRLAATQVIVSNGDINLLKYDNTNNISYGVSLAGDVAFRLYNDEVSVGISSKVLRFYGSNVLLSNGGAVTSDARKKHSIEPLDSRYLELIRMLKPKRFKYNSCSNDRYHIGLIAQDLKKAMEKCGLYYDDLAAFLDIKEDGSEYAIRYGEITALLLEYVKYLENRVDKLVHGFERSA